MLERMLGRPRHIPHSVWLLLRHRCDAWIAGSWKDGCERRPFNTNPTPGVVSLAVLPPAPSAISCFGVPPQGYRRLCQHGLQSYSCHHLLLRVIVLHMYV